MQPILFRIPVGADGIPVYGFGMMLFVVFLATTWLAARRAVKAGIAPEVLQDLAIWIFLGGLIGARLTFLIFHEGMRDPVEILKRLPRIWDGGIIFYGAVAGALVAYVPGYWFFFRHKPNVTTLRLADVIAPTIALGLIVGRFGCFLNGCCYGQVACPPSPGLGFPMSSPAMETLVAGGHQTLAGFLLDPEARGEARVWRVQPGSPAERSGLRDGDVVTRVRLGTGEDREVRSATEAAKALTAEVPRDQRADVALTVQRAGKTVALPSFRPRTLGLHATQLYESISMALLLLVLLAFDPFKRREGQVMALMMIGYAVHRYLNEILRSDERPVGFESNVSVLLFVGGLVLMAWVSLRRAGKPAAGPEAKPVMAGAASR